MCHRCMCVCVFVYLLEVLWGEAPLELAFFARTARLSIQSFLRRWSAWSGAAYPSVPGSGASLPRNFHKISFNQSKALTPFPSGSPINETMQREASPFEKLSETNLYIRGLSADVSTCDQGYNWQNVKGESRLTLSHFEIPSFRLTINSMFRQQTWTCKRCAKNLAILCRQKQ